MNRIFIVATALFAAATALSQPARNAIAEIPERAGGVYYAYPESEITSHNDIPKGYQPFYVSHYGRHGSRFLISDDDYKRVVDCLDAAHTAGELTQKGEYLRQQLDTIWEEARGRGGELTPLGARQHHDIAMRMAKNYPQVFAGNAEVTAASTQVMRCAHSMFNFVDGLKESNPQLDVPMESSARNMYYLCFHTPESGKFNDHSGPWYQDYKRFKASRTNPERLVSELFKDKKYVDMWVDTDQLMWDLYYVAVDVQNMDTTVDLLSLFTTDELFGLWEVANFGFFARNSSYVRANGLHTANARNLLNNIIDGADNYISSGKHGATLRFGHDGNIIPLLALIQVANCYSDAERPEDLSTQYADFFVCPMGTNLQFVFFSRGNNRNPDDILVRVLHNENDAPMPVQTAQTGTKAVYYRWSDMRNFLNSLANN